jgi:hypothetical protein
VFGRDGTLFLLNPNTREIHAFAPGEERGARILGAGAFPATAWTGHMYGFRGALFLPDRDLLVEPWGMSEKALKKVFIYS